MTELRVLQYRTAYVNGTPTSSGERSMNTSSRRLRLITVALVEEDNKTLEFVEGNKYSIWPGSYS